MLLVRHGQTASTGTVLPGRAAGLDLSEAGRDQAQRTAELDRRRGNHRCRVHVVARAGTPDGGADRRRHGHTSAVDRGLLECDFGEWTGERLATLMKKPEWATVQRAPSTFRFPGGESFVEMQTRIVSTIDRLRAAHEGKTIVCVSHADPIKAAIAQAIGTHLDLFQRIVISPARSACWRMSAAVPSCWR